MTEAEWLAFADSHAMLQFLMRKFLRAVGSVRKLRLFLTNYSRRIWYWFHDYRCRHASEVAERSAEGLVSDEEWLGQVHNEMVRVGNEQRS